VSAEVEIPAFFVDAVVLDDLGTGAGDPWIQIVNRDPEPGETGVRVDLPILFDMVTDSGWGSTKIQVYVRVGTGPEILVMDLFAAFVEPGWTANVFGTFPDGTRFEIIPPVDFPSLIAVQVRVDIEGDSGGTPTNIGTSWSFTTEDLVAPEVSSAFARDSRTVRITFNEPVSDTALDPEAYTFERLSAFPQAAVDVSAVAVIRVSSAVVDVTLDLELSNAPYQVTATGVEDLFENVIGPPLNAATFQGLLCTNAPADRRFELWRMIPQKNREEDATRELEAFFSCLQDVTDLLLCQVDAWTDILDPDKASEPFLDAMLLDLGNPFSFDLSVQEKRRLISVLVAAYKQKGTAVGIVNLVRLFLGLEVGVIAFNGGGGWELGVDEIGDLELGPSDSFSLYSFEVVATEALTEALTEDQIATITTIARYMKPAHTHLITVRGPVASLVVDHVELGLSELGDEFILH